MLDVKLLGKNMPRNRSQNGFVKPTGKKPRTWSGYWYVYVEGVRKERSKVLGLRSELTKGEAERLLQEHVRNFKPDAESSFEQAAKHYLSLKQGDWGRKNRGCIQSIFENQIIPRIGARRVSEIKPTDIKEFFNAVASAGSQSLVKKCMTHVRAVFDSLVEDDILAKNPAKSKIVTTPKTRKPSDRFLELHECRALLSCANGRDYLILRILLSCALRPSEVFAIRLDDVQPGQLRIDEAAVPGEAVHETKTEESNSWVPVSPALEIEIRSFIAAHRMTEPRAFLFPSEVGTAMDHDNYLDRKLKPIADAAKLKGVNFQVLRRTVATHMQDHGEAKSAQGLLRHTDASTTLKHYQKKLDASVAKAANSWDSALMNPGTLQ